ncbi:MAG: hypothetical protein EOO04_37250 [Chitinophagaceae bacterium]|nr:MAG: hypothetical protein EOO04_37250 [Chitinophagaceae bacterium]
MRIVFFLLFYGIIISSFAQQETANWFLKGNHIRVTPSGISNGNFNGQRPPFEARALSTSVSDAAGNLLFACDGGIVVDRNFQPMPGLSANISAQGSNLIALQVPNSTRYYIFYTTRNDYIDINASFTNRYLLIDMQFNGGKGAVVEEGKIIDPDGSAGFTTVEDNLSGKCWLVIHANKTGKFKAYEILSTGLNTTPVISDAGIAPVKERYIVKQLKTSPNGKMIAGIVDWIDRSSPFYGGAGWIEVFKFDGQTGIVINQVFIDVPYGYSNSFHSVEFSPDNRLLYGGFMSRVAGLQPSLEHTVS